MVSFGLALETLKRILRQVHGKHAARFGRAMKWAGAAHLLPRYCSRFKVKQFQYVAYRDHRPDSAKVDTRHRLVALNGEEEPVTTSPSLPGYAGKNTRIREKSTLPSDEPKTFSPPRQPPQNLDAALQRLVRHRVTNSKMRVALAKGATGNDEQILADRLRDKRSARAPRSFGK